MNDTRRCAALSRDAPQSGGGIEMVPVVKNLGTSVRQRLLNYMVATWAGSISMAAFIVAFSLVIKHLWKLW